MKSCPTLCDPGDYSPPGSSVQGMSQARTLERVSISTHRRGLAPCPQCQGVLASCCHSQSLGSLHLAKPRYALTPDPCRQLLTMCVFMCLSVCVCVCVCSVVCNSTTPWTVAHQVALSMGFSWQEYWSGLPFPPPGDLLGLGIELTSAVAPTLQADSLHAEPLGNYIVKDSSHDFNWLPAFHWSFLSYLQFTSNILFCHTDF